MIPICLDNFEILNPTEVNEKCQLRQVNEVMFQLVLCFNTPQIKVYY